MLRSLIVLLLFFDFISCQAQVSTNISRPQVNLSAFVDVFYIYDFTRPQGTSRQPFFFSHNRHNEISLNMGMIQLEVDHSRYRSSLAFNTGTYSIDNYAAEPPLYQIIYEAYAGVALNSNSTLWVDAGVLPGNIGFESAVSMDNYTMTRSLLAEHSPYYNSGVRLSYTPNNKWYLAGLVMNGWQRIQQVEGNSLLSFGSQVTYTPKEKLTFNWSTFVGTDDPDQSRRMRYFNNFYVKYALSNKLRLISGFDYGIQQISKGSTTYDQWYSIVTVGQYSFNNELDLGMRLEWFSDRGNVVIPRYTEQEFETSLASLNLDYKPNSNVMLRSEISYMGSSNGLFGTGHLDRNSLFVGSSISIRFNYRHK